MKKQASDQQSHERRFQERKRAEAMKPTKKKGARPAATVIPPEPAPKA